MKTKAYTMLGWAAWQGIVILVKRQLGTNKIKLGAAATVLGVVAAGVLMCVLVAAPRKNTTMTQVREPGSLSKVWPALRGADE